MKTNFATVLVGRPTLIITSNLNYDCDEKNLHAYTSITECFFFFSFCVISIFTHFSYFLLLY